MQSRLDKSPVATWWWTIDRWFLAAFLSLMGLGIVLSFAASPAVAERIGLDSFHFATRQVIFTIPALVVMLAVSFLEARQRVTEQLPDAIEPGIKRLILANTEAIGAPVRLPD